MKATIIKMGHINSKERLKETAESLSNFNDLLKDLTEKVSVLDNKLNVLMKVNEKSVYRIRALEVSQQAIFDVIKLIDINLSTVNTKINAAEVAKSETDAKKKKIFKRCSDFFSKLK